MPRTHKVASVSVANIVWASAQPTCVVLWAGLHQANVAAVWLGCSWSCEAGKDGRALVLGAHKVASVSLAHIVWASASPTCDSAVGWAASAQLLLSSWAAASLVKQAKMAELWCWAPHKVASVSVAHIVWASASPTCESCGLGCISPVAAVWLGCSRSCKAGKDGRVLVLGAHKVASVSVAHMVWAAALPTCGSAVGWAVSGQCCCAAGLQDRVKKAWHTHGRPLVLGTRKVTGVTGASPWLGCTGLVVAQQQFRGPNGCSFRAVCLAVPVPTECGAT